MCVTKYVGNDKRSNKVLKGVIKRCVVLRIAFKMINDKSNKISIFIYQHCRNIINNKFYLLFAEKGHNYLYLRYVDPEFLKLFILIYSCRERVKNIFPNKLITILYGEK